MRTLFLFAGIVSVMPILAQRTIDVTNGDNGLNPSSFFTVSGTPFVNDKYVKLIEGSPYFSNDWMEALLVCSTGKEIKGVKVKLNLHNNSIHYLDDKENEMIAITSIREVVLTDASGNNYRFIHSSALPQQEKNPITEGWYHWLHSGKASLYKFYRKSLIETTPYGSATTEQRIKTKETYLVGYNNAFIKIGKVRDAPSVLLNKKSELETWLKKKDDSKASLDDRFTALVQFYNTLLVEQE